MARKTWKEMCREKRSLWRAHLKAWERSGLSQVDYCRRNNLKDTQFTYWKIKLYKEKSEQVNFAPVPVHILKDQSIKDSDDSGLCVQVGTIQIRLSNNFNTASLLKVVSTLEARQ
jgi:hypothetical protein